jgi:hypothetical protein
VLTGLVGVDLEATVSGGADPYAGACSEKAAVSKADATATRERERQASLDAAAEEERIAEEEQAAKDTEEALVGKSAGELEAA